MATYTWGCSLVRRSFLILLYQRSDTMFTAHTSDSTQNKCADLNVHTATVPGGCTSLVQPADVSWNKPFKAHLETKYATWMATGERSFTRRGRRRAPSYHTLCEWIVSAWASISRDLIIKSFMVCGISSAVDRTEESMMKCLCDTANGLSLLESESGQLTQN